MRTKLMLQRSTDQTYDPICEIQCVLALSTPQQVLFDDCLFIKRHAVHRISFEGVGVRVPWIFHCSMMLHTDQYDPATRVCQYMRVPRVLPLVKRGHDRRTSTAKTARNYRGPMPPHAIIEMLRPHAHNECQPDYTLQPWTTSGAYLFSQRWQWTPTQSGRPDASCGCFAYLREEQPPNRE